MDVNAVNLSVVALLGLLVSYVLFKNLSSTAEGQYKNFRITGPAAFFICWTFMAFEFIGTGSQQDRCFYFVINSKVADIKKVRLQDIPGKSTDDGSRFCFKGLSTKLQKAVLVVTLKDGTVLPSKDIEIPAAGADEIDLTSSMPQNASIKVVTPAAAAGPKSVKNSNLESQGNATEVGPSLVTQQTGEKTAFFELDRRGEITGAKVDKSVTFVIPKDMKRLKINQHLEIRGSAGGKAAWTNAEDLSDGSISVHLWADMNGYTNLTITAVTASLD
jgi:hypothetical protein